MSSATSPGSSDPAPAAAATAGGRELSIVIVSWNVREMLADCLRSLEDDGVHEWAQVIVVDNESSDGSSAMVADSFPWVNLIDSGSNLGFSRGSNLGMEAGDGELVLLLNPDTVVHPGAVSRMVEHMRRDPECGAAGARLIGQDGEIQLEGAVALPTCWNVCCDFFLASRLFPNSRLFNRRKMGYWSHQDDRRVPGVPGTAMMLRRRVLDQVGLLDETMFIVEDMDMCRRVAAAGWSIWYLGSAHVVHYGGASISQSGGGFGTTVAFQSLWLYFRKHGQRLQARALSAAMFCWSLAASAGLTLLALLRPSLPRERIRKLRETARGIRRWALGDKTTFKHHLAAAPDAADADSSNPSRQRVETT